MSVSTEVCANPFATASTISTHNALIEIKNAAQELLTRLEKYKPENPLLSPVARNGQKGFS